MAVAVDHVQFAVPDVGRAADYLIERGFVRAFDADQFDRGVTGLFRTPGKRLVFLRGANINVELVTGANRPGPGTYSPVFEPTATPVFVPELASTCRGEPGPKLAGLDVHVADLERSRAFWVAMGFVEQLPATSPPRLEHEARPMGTGLTVFLHPAPASPEEPRYPDDLGCSLVALIDLKVAATIAQHAALLSSTSATHRFDFERHSVEITMVTGPSLELVELVRLIPRKRERGGVNAS